MCKYYGAFYSILHAMNIARHYDRQCNPTTDIENITNVIVGTTISYALDKIDSPASVRITLVQSIENETSVECLKRFQVSSNIIHIDTAACVLTELEQMNALNFEETVYNLGYIVSVSRDNQKCAQPIKAIDSFSRFNKVIQKKWNLMREFTRHKSDSALVVRANMHDALLSHDKDKINGIRIFTSHSCTDDKVNVSIDLLHFTKSFIHNEQFLDTRLQDIRVAHARTNGMLYIEQHKSATLTHNPYATKMVTTQVNGLPLQIACAVSTIGSISLLLLTVVKYGSQIPGISHTITVVNNIAHCMRVRLQTPINTKTFKRFGHTDVEI